MKDKVQVKTNDKSRFLVAGKVVFYIEAIGKVQ